MSSTFADLGLSQALLDAIAALGFTQPSPIQTLAIPLLLEGRDVIGQAQTGTGKTAAFGLPILESLDASLHAPQALILCPTRELAVQVAEELEKFGARQRGLFVVPVYGGQSIDRQLRALSRGAHIVVGTPGRLMDHLERGSLRLDSIVTTVLDEADEMLDMGFRDDIESILEKTPTGSQRVFFSATMPRAMLDMARRFLNEPEIARVQQKTLTVEAIEQSYFMVPQHLKTEALRRVLDAQAFRKALVFCATKRNVDAVTAHLQSAGYQADSLHGDLAQNQRDRVMGGFRGGMVKILVATDVAARGIDVDDVDAVINYDIPYDVENYVHRIGRTGRAGRKGCALTFVTSKEQFKLRTISRSTTANIAQKSLPSLRDVAQLRVDRLLESIGASLEEGELDMYSALLQRFRGEDFSAENLSAALLKLLLKKEGDVQALFEKNVPDPLALPQYERRERRAPAYERAAPGRKPGNFGSPRPHQTPSQAMARLFFNVGSKRNVGPRDLVGAIAGETGISSRSIGSIEVHEQFSFVEIPTDLVDGVLSVMNTAQIRGFKVTVQHAMPKRRMDAPPA